MLKKNPSQPEELKRMIGPLKIDLEQDGSLDNLGQPNIIDYVDHEPFLTSLSDRGLGGGQPGTILPNNEPTSRSPYPVDGLRPGGEYDKMSGHGAVGADRAQPTLPTGHPTSIPKLLPTELQEAFVESEHPRDPDGKFTDGSGVDEDELENKLSYKTTIQGEEVDVNLRQKKSWEKHTTEEQRQDPGFNTSYSDDLKTQGEEQPEKPTTTKKPSVSVDVTPKEPAAAPGIGPEPTRDLYKDLPKDTDKAGEGRKQRKEVFAKHEKENGELYW